MRTLVATLLGALLGTAAVAWLGPRFIHWYAQPPFAMGCDCGPAMGWALERLVIGEAGGALVGSAVAVGAFIGFGRRRAKGPVPPTAAPAA